MQNMLFVALETVLIEYRTWTMHLMKVFTWKYISTHFGTDTSDLDLNQRAYDQSYIIPEVTTFHNNKTIYLGFCD